MQDPQFYEMTPKEAPRKHGCLFYGCITVIVLTVLIGIMVFLGVRAVYNRMYEYTEEKPMAFPPLQMAEEDRKDVKKRLEDFIAAVKEGKETEPLVLDSDDCNALIQSGEHNSLRDRVYVKIEGDEVKGQLSWPLDGIPGMKGRYINGEADLKVSLTDGVLVATIDSVSVKGKPLPPEALAGIRAQNLAQDFYKDPDNAKALSKLESIEVKDGKITVKARKPKEKAEGEEKKADDADAAKVEDQDKAKADDRDQDKAKAESDEKKADDQPPPDAPKDKDAPTAEPAKPADHKAAA